MNNLKKIVDEIEKTSKYYNKSHFKEVRDAYVQHIEMIILEAPKTEQYNLHNYWSRLKNIP